MLVPLGCVYNVAKFSDGSPLTMKRRLSAPLFVGALVLALSTVFAACGDDGDTDPISVINTFHEALNSGDVDGMLAVIADDAVISSGGTFASKDEIRGWAQALVDSKNRVVAQTDFEVTGDEVGWIAEVEVDGTPAGKRIGEAVVRGGKIRSLTLRAP